MKSNKLHQNNLIIFQKEEVSDPINSLMSSNEVRNKIIFQLDSHLVKVI